ncbi:hypothetical protein BRD01_02970, partial [Halobacteriales archaeon QS_8_65_32]
MDELTTAWTKASGPFEAVFSEAMKIDENRFGWDWKGPTAWRRSRGSKDASGVFRSVRDLRPRSQSER